MLVPRRSWWSSLAAILAAMAGCSDPNPSGSKGSARPLAVVEVANVEHGSIALVRTFTGALEAPGRLEVAAKIAGRVEKIAVDIGDPVQLGQVLVELEDDELVQLAAQANAALEVARANAVEADGAAALAQRELGRLETLRGRGVASASQLDAARADAASKAAAVAVAAAEVTQAKAARDAARIRLGYTKIVARWRDDGGARVVAERLIDEGTTVAANARLLSIVQLDPLLAVVSVPERDYRFLQAGLTAEVRTDAYPGETFPAKVIRVAPVFAPDSRQARVELEVPNVDKRLAPGMFAKVQVELRGVEGAVVVPKSAITQRKDQAGVFLVVDDGPAVAWRPVEIGIETPNRVQILSPELEGRVVISGQHLVDDGARVIIPGEDKVIER